MSVCEEKLYFKTVCAYSTLFHAHEMGNNNACAFMLYMYTVTCFKNRAEFRFVNFVLVILFW